MRSREMLRPLPGRGRGGSLLRYCSERKILVSVLIYSLLPKVFPPNPFFFSD